jgi:hypothetical protein
MKNWFTTIRYSRIDIIFIYIGYQIMEALIT